MLVSKSGMQIMSYSAFSIPSIIDRPNPWIRFRARMINEADFELSDPSLISFYVSMLSVGNYRISFR